MVYLITGGNGYLGKALAQRLMTEGHKIRVLDVRSGDLDCDYRKGDITDSMVVDAAAKGVDGVFHAAAIVGFWKQKRAWQRGINVAGTENVMRAALKHGVAKVVYTSTINTLGFVPTENDVGDEETAYNWSPYDVSYMETKYEAEQLVLRLVREEKLPATIVNPGTIFGGDVKTGYNANRYIELIRHGQMPTYPTGGTNCVALEDVVDGHVAAMAKGRAGERYVLGAENMTYKGLFEFIAAELGVQAPLIPLIEGPTGFAAGIAEKAFELFGKEPPFTAEMVRASSRFSFYSNAKARRELGIAFRDFKPYLSALIRKAMAS